MASNDDLGCRIAIGVYCSSTNHHKTLCDSQGLSSLQSVAYLGNWNCDSKMTYTFHHLYVEVVIISILKRVEVAIEYLGTAMISKTIRERPKLYQLAI